jgi:hypothetical protein
MQTYTPEVQNPEYCQGYRYHISLRMPVGSILPTAEAREATEGLTVKMDFARYNLKCISSAGFGEAEERQQGTDKHEREVESGELRLNTRSEIPQLYRRIQCHRVRSCAFDDV